MDHHKAESTQAADRYLLGELSADEREQFEEHFFSCPECAEEVKAGSLFRANARAVFLEEARQPLVTRQEETGWLPWRNWRPVMAVSWAVTCVLLLFASYQSLVVVPGLRTQLAQITEPQSYQSYALRTVTRGDDLVLQVPRSARFIGLTVYLDPQYKFGAYRAEFQSDSGASRFSVTARAPSVAGIPLEFLVPAANLPVGGYAMLLEGLENSSQQGHGEQIGKYRFLVKRK